MLVPLMSRLPLLAALSLPLSIATPEGEILRRTPSGYNGIIVQMFEWTWDSVAAECTNFIGPAGYGFVQVSPAQEHIEGDQWWTDYQPVSYNITSKRGNRAQYQNMIETCHTAGVGVIADTIFNHMSGASSGTGVGGTVFTKYDYPGIYDTSNFHFCGEPDNAIQNYDNATDVQTCELEGLADLATETEYVRMRLAEYANDLISLGIDGFRLDAAEWIAATDIVNITSRLSKSPAYITQEVHWGSGQPITPEEYTGIGDVQEFRYTTMLKSAFLDDGINSLQNLDNEGWIAGDVANVFVTNHDTERDGSSLSDTSPSNTYTLALIFSLTHPYGTPTILSSFSFDNFDAGAPNNGAGSCSGSGGVDGWLCQHRWPAVAGMTGFRNSINAASSTDLANWVSPSSQQIAFSRGAAGFVAINNADEEWTADFATGLPGGSYCNVIEGPPSGGACAGASFSISSNGTVSASIGARSAIAFHIGALAN